MFTTNTSRKSSPSIIRPLLGPRLPIIDYLVNIAIKDADIVKLTPITVVVAVQHGLKTTGSLFQGFLDIGFLREHIYLTTKEYSNNKEFVDTLKQSGINYQENSDPRPPGYFSQAIQDDVTSLWSRLSNDLLTKPYIKNIIVLDEGGYLLSCTPIGIQKKYNLIGIEQTMNGYMKPEIRILSYPVIGVASSAAKRDLESYFIADAIIEKLKHVWAMIGEKNTPCGVVGAGVIGTAVANKLLSMGYKVYVYDKDFTKASKIPGAIAVEQINLLVANVDYIFGCTGNDITTSIAEFEFASRIKNLISCSSGEDEFLTLLRLYQQKHEDKEVSPHATLEYYNQAETLLRIFNRGRPINFDDSGTSVPNDKIQLTRALLFLAVLQALKYLTIGYKHVGKHMLSPEGQKVIYDAWVKFIPDYPFPKKVKEIFNSVSIIKSRSSGIYKPFLLHGLSDMNIIKNDFPFFTEQSLKAKNQTSNNSLLKNNEPCVQIRSKL